MEITIDLNFFNSLFNLLLKLGENAPIIITWIIFKNGGWVFVLWAFLWGFWKVWVEHRGREYTKGINYVLLAFNIPKENEQSPKAIEHIFSQLMGAYGSINLIEKYWQGKVQPKFSLEIVSLEGYIQFLIRTPDKFRDLVEAAFYAQYPEAEITEVADYTQNVPIEKFPSEEYDLHGSEIILAKDDIYPIKTYPNFEHPLTQEFKDPMAALLEIFCKLQKGEQIWIQIIISPYLKANKTLRERGLNVVNKIAGKKEMVHENVTDKGINLFMKTMDWFGEIIYPLWKPHDEKKIEISLMQHLTPGEKIIIEAIEQKISKIGFKTKIRFVYLAKKEVFSSRRGVSPVFGAFQQFNTLNLNEFRPDSKSIIKYFYFFNKIRRDIRKTRLFRNYKARERTAGSDLFILNIEELATIFHFPVLTVTKTPLISKTLSRTAEPPFTLPIGDDNLNLDQTLEHKLRLDSNAIEKKQEEKEKPSSINLPTNMPPDNLPTG
ncbi:MAG: hypothetical protein ABH808_04205 [Candidatus Kuenenbacteria bacterium]